MAGTEPDGASTRAPQHDRRVVDSRRVPAERAAPVVPGPRAATPSRGASGDDPGGGSALAWLVRPVTHVPGVLHLAGDRLRFVSTRGVIVDGTLESLGVTAARTGRGGFRLTVGDERPRLHVVRFAGAVDVPAELRAREAPEGLLTVGEPSAGAVWRRLLAPPRPSTAATPEPPEARDGSAGGRAATGSRFGSGRTIRVRGWRPVRARRACAAPAPWY